MGPWLLSTVKLCGMAASVLTLTVLFQRYQTWRQKTLTEAKLAKKKQFKKLPQWAIKKSKELDHFPRLTDSQLRLLEQRKPSKTWNTVILFPNLVESRQNAPLNQLLFYFRQARTSIYLCMYLCSNFTLSNAVRDKYDEGLIVNVVSEYDTWTAHNNKGIKDLAHHGIDVRLNRNGFMMHNKFAIIDEEAVITGSLNWTRQGVESNNENVMISTDPQIVSKYLKEFNKLFSQCKRWELEVS